MTRNIPVPLTAGSGLLAIAATSFSSNSGPKLPFRISHQAGQGAVDLDFKAQETDQYYLIEGSTELTPDSWTLNYGVKGDGKDKTATMPTHNDKGFYRLLRVDAKDPRLQMDADNDGIPSAVEMSLDFNLNPGKSEDGAIDHDGDGYTALEEYLAGTKDSDQTSQPPALESPTPLPALALPSASGKTLFQLEYFQESYEKTSGSYYPSGGWSHRSTRQARINFIDGKPETGKIRTSSWSSETTGATTLDADFPSRRLDFSANYPLRTIRKIDSAYTVTEDDQTETYDGRIVDMRKGSYRITQFSGPPHSFLIEHEHYANQMTHHKETTTTDDSTTEEDSSTFTQEAQKPGVYHYQLVHWDGSRLQIDGKEVPLPTGHRSAHYPYGIVRLPKPVHIALVPDWNRDGAIAQADRKRATETTPFRFWVNDDDDVDETSGDDRPRSGTADHRDAVVDSTRDLVDFFPLWLDLKAALDAVDDLSRITVQLRQEDSALNFVYTDLDPADAGDYLRESGLKTGFGPAFNKSPGPAPTHAVTAQGTALSTAFLKKIRDQGKGVLLFEGAKSSTRPLVLELRYTGSTAFATVELPLSLASVSAMYHQVNLASRIPGTTETIPDATGQPANWPDTQCNDQTFAFIHGYKISQSDAQGWHAEIFKRLHQLGSRARFVGITWHGATGNDYHKAVYQAFVTSQHLAGELAAYSNLTIAAHSLGNMVVSNAIENHSFSPARFCMLNAAVPIEAFTATQTSNSDQPQSNMPKHMTEKSWQAYPDRLYAANWYELFPDTDKRSQLTWKDRFESVRNRAYNFYSTGEDVLKNAKNGETVTAALLDHFKNWVTGQNAGSHAWVTQEIAKGGKNLLTHVAFSELHGGWKRNDNQSDLKQVGIKKSLPPDTDSYRPRFASETSATVPTDEQLAQFGFFKRFHDCEGQSLYAPINDANAISGVTQTQAQASTLAGVDDTQWHLLAEAIPAQSFAAGTNSVVGMQGNIDLMQQQNGWPENRLNNQDLGNRWLHSDFKKLSLNYVRKLYDQLIETGGLDNE